MSTVDVLIVNYRTPELTAAAVAAVSHPEFRVLVWDNSADLPVLPGADVYGGAGNLYFAEANNRLFRLGESPFVLLLNPDVELSAGTLAELVRRLEATPTAWGITLRLLGVDGSRQNYLHGLPTTRGLLADRLPPLRPLLRRDFRRYRCLDVDLTQGLEVEQPPAAALLLRRSEHPDGGPFDGAFPLFFNDVELSRRMNLAGACLYAGDLTAHHVGGASLRTAGGRREPVNDMYDAALLLYARRNLRHGYPLVRLAVALRRLADRFHPGWWR